MRISLHILWFFKTADLFIYSGIQENAEVYLRSYSSSKAQLESRPNCVCNKMGRKGRFDIFVKNLKIHLLCSKILLWKRIIFLFSLLLDCDIYKHAINMECGGIHIIMKPKCSKKYNDNMPASTMCLCVYDQVTWRMETYLNLKTCKVKKKPK